MTQAQRLHSWAVTPKQAVQIQRKLADRVIRRGVVRPLRTVAGCDAAFSPQDDLCIAGVVVWDVRAGRVVEQHVIRRKLGFPYVPGLLSFREIPALMQAVAKLQSEPDVFLFDGQGFAHPRRFGLACHAGVLLDRPAVGCAKSVLVGEFEMPDPKRGSLTPLIHKGERVGTALRTRDGVRPVYISIGHRVSLRTAGRIVLRCACGYRLPEPTRLADRLVAAAKSQVVTGLKPRVKLG